MVYTVFKHKPVQEIRIHKITALACIENQFLVLGTDQGALLVYQFHPDRSTEKFDISTFSSSKAPVSAAVTQIVPLPKLGMILTLANGTIFQHRFTGQSRDSLETGKPVPKSVKGCTIMAVKKERDRYTIAAGAKRKLFILEYRNDEFVFTNEFSLPDTARTLAWCKSRIFIGFKKEYTSLDISSTKEPMKEVFGTGSNPLSLSMQQTGEVLLVKEGKGYAQADRATRNCDMNWVSPDIFELGYAHPYVISLNTNGVEVRAFPFPNDKDSKPQKDICCQLITLKNPKCLSLPNFVDFDAVQGLPRAVARAMGPKSGSDEAGSKDYSPKGTTKQELVFIINQENVLHVLLPVPFSDQLEELILKNKPEDFDKALVLCDVLTNDDIQEAQYEKVCMMYGFHLFSRKLFREAMNQFNKANIDPRTVIKIFRGMLPKYVEEKWAPPESHMKSIAICKEAIREVADERNAMLALKTFLKIRRSTLKLEPLKDPFKQDLSDEGMQAAAVDTALLRVFLHSADSDCIEFLKQPNRCVLEDCERDFSTQRKWLELVTLYQSRKLDRKALELLRHIGEEELKSGVEPSKQIGVPKTIEYIQNLSSGDDFPTTRQELILEYSSWVLRAVPSDRSLEMFYHKKGNLLNPLTVFDHLVKVLPNDMECHASYLELLLGDPKYSTVERKDSKEYYCVTQVHENLINTYHKLITRYTSTGQASASAEVSAKLQRFLRTSSLYTPETVKSRFTSSEFSRECSIVCAKLEQHEEALGILAHSLNSFEEAVAYCDLESKVEPEKLRRTNKPRPGAEKREDLYYLLLSVLLQPPKGMKPKVDEALRLLRLHHDKINSLKAIKLLPGDIPVSELSDWMIQVLKNVSIQQRDLRIYHGLCKSEHHQVAVQRAMQRRGHIVRDANDICAICRTKIGVCDIKCYPSKVVVHISCDQQLGHNGKVCPVTKKRYTDLDALLAVPPPVQYS